MLPAVEITTHYVFERDGFVSLVERTVDEGDAVTKGMLIARIDRDQMDQQRTRDTAGVSSAEWAMQQSKTSIDWQRQTLAGDIDLKKAALRQAQQLLRGQP